MTVHLRRLTPAAEEVWAALFALAEETTKSWIPVGGQMVLVLAVELEAERVRLTEDIDVVVNARAHPDSTQWLSGWREKRDFALEGVSTDHIGHRFIRATSAGRGKVAFEVLAPTGVGERARLTTVPPARTVQTPGSLQAFERSRLLEVLISDFTDDNERIGHSPWPSEVLPA